MIAIISGSDEIPKGRVITYRVYYAHKEEPWLSDNDKYDYGRIDVKFGISGKELMVQRLEQPDRPLYPMWREDNDVEALISDWMASQNLVLSSFHRVHFNEENGKQYWRNKAEYNKYKDDLYLAR